MKNFYHYLAESKKDFTYRIKMICASVDEATLDRIERALVKYDVLEVSPPRKTILHAAPLDFKEVSNAEVWIIDIRTGQPASSFYIQQEISNALGLNQKFVVVRGSNDPIEQEVERSEDLYDIAQTAGEKQMVPAALLDMPDYGETAADEPVKPLYGDDYNKNLLNYLAMIQADRPSMVAVPEETKAAGLFKWLGGETPAGADFNAEFDTVKPVSGLRNEGESASTPPVSRTGAVEDNGKRTTGLFQDSKGNTTVIASTRKGK